MAANSWPGVMMYSGRSAGMSVSEKVDTSRSGECKRTDGCNLSCGSAKRQFHLPTPLHPPPVTNCMSPHIHIWAAGLEAWAEAGEKSRVDSRPGTYGGLCCGWVLLAISLKHFL